MAEQPSAHFYRSRGIAEPDVINDDRRCLQCGRALKGLRVGDECPGCGRRVLRDRATGLNEAPIPILQRLRAALTLTLFSWTAGMALWFWCYYGFWSNAGPVLAGLLSIVVIPAVLIVTEAWNALERSPDQPLLSMTTLLRFALGAAVVLLGVLLFAESSLTPAPSRELVLTLVAVTSFVWIGLQAIACLVFSRIAAEGGDSKLGDRYFNLSWALGLAVSFISPYLAVTQAMQARSGLVPVCCMSGYLVIIGFFVAQIMFIVSAVQLRAVVNWAIRYRDQYNRKTAEMAERIEEARRAGEGEGTVYVRE
jgi:hypothetical protein